MFLNQNMAQVRVVVDLIMGLTNIANGDIYGAADRKASLARTMPAAINFIANLIVLGGPSDRIRGFIERVQSIVDRAIDRLVAKVMDMIFILHTLNCNSHFVMK